MKKSKLNNDLTVSVILPTYNESRNIGPLIDDITELLKNRNYEIIVVDDDSPDGTMNVVEEKNKQNRRVNLICRTDRRGLTSALNDGIAHAQGEIVLWMDSDFQMPPSVVPELIEKVENGYDAAIGSRFIKVDADLRHKNEKIRGIVGVHRNLSKLICRLTSRAFKSEIKDWTSGFIAIKRELLDGVDLFGDYGEYFIYLVHYLENRGYRVVEVPYDLMTRRYGDSKTLDGYIGMIGKGVKYLYAVPRLLLLHTHENSVFNKEKKNYESGKKG